MIRVRIFMSTAVVGGAVLLPMLQCGEPLKNWNWTTITNLPDTYHNTCMSTNDPDAIKKAKYIYSACIDTDYIEENYADQLYSFMIKAGGWENGDFSPYNSWSINNNLYQDHYLGSSALFTFGSLPDDLNSSKQVIKVTSIAIHMLNSCTYN